MLSFLPLYLIIDALELSLIEQELTKMLLLLLPIKPNMQWCISLDFSIWWQASLAHCYKVWNKRQDYSSILFVSETSWHNMTLLILKNEIGATNKAKINNQKCALIDIICYFQEESSWWLFRILLLSSCRNTNSL